ncbi:MAG: C25 family cysteine peptidase [Candidatus Eisenbacteria bacterium]
MSRNLALYGVAGDATPPAARLVGVSWVRNQRIATIEILPGAYEPASRRLTMARRVDVDVQVQPMGSLGAPAEPDDPFEGVYRQSLVNYEQGRQWRHPGAQALAAAAKRMNLAPASAEAATPPTTSVFAGHQWIKIAVEHAGFYAVDYSSLRSLSLFADQTSPVAFDQLRVVTLPGYPIIPADNFCDSCDYQQVAIGTFDADAPANGLFSSNTDYLYFFAQGPNGWANDYDPQLPDTLYLDHPYETKNYYYLTIVAPGDNSLGAPLRIGTTSGLAQAVAPDTVRTTPAREHYERDLTYAPDATPRGSTLFWEKWYWTIMSPGSSLPTTLDLPYADTTQAARFRLRQWGLTDNTEFGSCPGNVPDHFLNVTVNGQPFAVSRPWYSFLARRGGQLTVDTTAVFLRRFGNLVTVNVPVVSTPGCPSRVDKSALAWFEIHYQRTLQPDADQLEFRSPATAGTYWYKLGPFVTATLPRLFDITDPLVPLEVTVPGAQWTHGTDGWYLAFEQTQSGGRRYRVQPDSILSVARLARTNLVDAPLTSLENLRDPTEGANYLVIYYDAFQTAAKALADARKTRLPLGGNGPFLTKAIPVSALFDQFSGGRTDPAAIRNFLRAAYYNWSTRPSFVTFLGDASYDFKNLTGRAPTGQPGTLVPTFENGFDDNYRLKRQFATDDWLLNVDAASSELFVPDFFGGRLPANDAASALAVVQKKVLQYESSVPFGEYRNDVMLIADNDLQGENCDALGWAHISQTDELNRNHIPTHVDRTYVYLHTYPSGAGGSRPGARADIRSTIDSGVGLFNYVGHGSPFKITDESVFIDSDAGTLQNGNRMPVFVAASCDVGKFNDPTVQSLGEQLVMTPGAGCVAVISATEQAFSSDNSQLNKYLYDQLFTRGDITVNGITLVGVGQYHVPLSAALLSAKISAPGTGPTNNAKYQLMGDAATVLNTPKLWGEVRLTDTNGADLAALQRGQVVTFQGRVLDRPFGDALPFEGVASVLVEDSAPTANTGEEPPCTLYSVDFRYRAGTVYHGDVSISNGAFEGRFVVPVDAALGSTGRVRVYLSGTSGATTTTLDGAGAVSATYATGTLSGTDTSPPRISLSFLGGSTAVRPDATLRADLFDESGIMTTGHSLQNSIVVTVDDNTTSRVDITSSFRYAADSYQQGTATFTLPGLATGHHKIKVSAADNLATGITASQHRSSAEIEFDVVETPRLSITRAYLFPNPIASGGAASGGTFVVDAPGDSVNTLVKIYTVSGRLVRTLTHRGALGQVQLLWDGLDAEGDPLANGTYLFKVYANGREADGTSSPSQKASTEGRFVVLNRK